MGGPININGLAETMVGGQRGMQQSVPEQEGILRVPLVWTFAGHYRREVSSSQPTSESVTVCTGILPTTSCIEPVVKVVSLNSSDFMSKNSCH